jgi:L-histidine N-alpha-methyltransferase
MISANIRPTPVVDIVRPLHASHHPEETQIAVWRDLSAPLPQIDSKYFYDDLGSQLFEDITALPEYYQTRTEEALIESIADEIIDLTQPIELLELGSGAGRKIRLLLDAGRRRRMLSSCVLLDVNESFLAASAEQLAGDYAGL